MLLLCATSELWCAVQVQNGFEDLRSDHQVMKALVFSTFSQISFPLHCHAQVELKEMSVAASDSNPLTISDYFQMCCRILEVGFLVRVVKATTYNSNRKFVHEMAEAFGSKLRKLSQVNHDMLRRMFAK